MIKRIFCVIFFVVVASLPVLAQEIPKVEVYGGYTWAGGNFKGVNTSVTRNFNKWFGLTADFSSHNGKEQEGSILVNKDARTIQGGPRFSHRGKRFTPFAYALFGITRFHESATVSGKHLSQSDKGFTSTFGGGLDVTTSDRVAIRLFQIDYYRPNFYGEAHNRLRASFGVVFRLGKKAM